MILQTLLNDKGAFKSDYLQDDIINLIDVTFEFPNDYSYTVFEVTNEYIARPDLISYDAYGDTMYSDIICKVNGISNPFELNEGTLLIIPTYEDIYKFMVKPSLAEKETCAFDKDSSGNSEVKPIAKPKNQKRKANEAVVGDSRFKIDPVAGIVIY